MNLATLGVPFQEDPLRIGGLYMLAQTTFADVGLLSLTGASCIKLENKVVIDVANTHC